MKWKGVIYMSFEPIEGVKLEDIVTEAATELLVERKRQATSLIKNFLMKVEGVTTEIKQLKRQLESKEETLTKTLDKIERLKKGDWSLLNENSGTTKPDSEHKNEE